MALAEIFQSSPPTREFFTSRFFQVPSVSPLRVAVVEHVSLCGDHVSLDPLSVANVAKAKFPEVVSLSVSFPLSHRSSSSNIVKIRLTPRPGAIGIKMN